MNRSTHPLVLSLLACALQTAFAATPIPQQATAGKPAKQDASATSLSPIVVTATRTEKTLDELPPSVTSTDRKTLDEKFIRDFKDLGDHEQPGIDMSRSGRYGGTNINIRGLEGNRVLMMVDGVRLPEVFSFPNRDTFVGQDMVDFSSLTAIDIVRGPGSTLYGSSALGGVVGMRTLDPTDLIKAGKTFGGQVKGDYDSADSSYGLSGAIAGEVNQDTYWLLQLGGRKGHELDNMGSNDSKNKNTRTTPDPQDYTTRNALAKVQHYFEGGHKLGLTGEYRKTESDTDLYSELGVVMPPAPTAITSSRAHDEQERKRVSLEYDYTAPQAGGLIDSASARMYYQKFDSDQRRDQTRNTRDPVYWRDGSYTETAKGISGQAVKNIGGSVTQQWVIGGEWWQTETKEFAAGYPASTSINLRTIPDTTVTQWALFAQDELGFDGGRYTLTPGIRYDNYRNNPDAGSLQGQINQGIGMTPKSQEDDKISPSLAGSWKFAEQATLFAKYAQGFRAPTTLEINGQFTNSAQGYTLVPNPDLKPETSSGYEFGVRLGNDNAGGTITGFDTRYKDFIDTLHPINSSYPGWIPGYPMVYQSVNIGKARIYGVEATAHYSFTSAWRTWGSLAWSVGRNETDDTWLDSVAPLKLITGLSYKQEVWGADALLTAAAAKTKLSSSNLYSAPGYGVVDLTAWWTPIKDVRISGGVFNVFDKKYWDGADASTRALTSNSVVVDRYTQPGRSFRVNANWSF
ncbi:TonB-dependent hemoglobin/transferrin/lactoferrin family receptor [Jeongeupia chitinilytica]|uniref:Outer membrane heme receptor n=1 Tax=Jeongeupia chitinilytica TaxID=1041641 RepID=A0ABQ3GWM0_9NEIS|nr:TonB-dependent hemoglobin/transferrin/lactoferrin family receptor [Jeongeupia chitinilytica]GHD58696.1 outer membrane heme receptor [Jeongeupia chitinilytica]